MFALSNGGTSPTADVVEQSVHSGASGGAVPLTALKASTSGLLKPVEVTEEGDHMGEFG